MPKHIKIKGTYQPETDNVLVEILEQTHRRDGEFSDQCNSDLNPGISYLHNNCLILCSGQYGRHCTLIECHYWANVVVCVLDRNGSKPAPFILTLAQWSAFVECVEAYNEEYKE